MIHHLRSMIGSDEASTQIAQDMGNGGARAVWVRAVPSPFYGGFFDRLSDAWAVLTERAYAVQWPLPGELEDALSPPKGRRQ